jgi:Uri superfamily endonuclease
MSIRLSIYDIFSRIVPGGFYLGILVEFARIMNLIPFNWMDLEDLGVLASLVLLLVAYIIGSAMDSMSYAWQKLFKINDRILEDFKKEHSEWKIDFLDDDWAILRAYVYVHNPDAVDVIERHNALSIMMRNISFGLVLLAACEMIQFIRTNDGWFIVVVVVLLFLSYQAGIQSKYLHDWFYRSIYETIIACTLKLEERVKPVEISAK